MRSIQRRSPFSSRRLALAISTVTATVLAIAAVVLPPTHESVAADSQTKIILNGEPVPVHFNDGDSFRILAGDHKDSKARLSGYNTLESYGPVHVWGTWTAKELYVIAKMGTYNGRDGVWECETDGKTDTYGRILVWCPTLAEDQIRKGYAHVLSIDDKPGDARLIAAQADAIAHKRGIWAHGVPDYILTSIHSKEEDIDGKGTYNRLVSTVDGHSVKWRHDNRYAECERVCDYVYTVDAATIDGLVATAKADSRLAATLGKLPDPEVRSVLYDFAKYRHINRTIAEDDREPLKTALLAWAEQGKFGSQTRSEGSCMFHVGFDRRFGGGKAACLK